MAKEWSPCGSSPPQLRHHEHADGAAGLSRASRRNRQRSGARSTPASARMTVVEPANRIGSNPTCRPAAVRLCGNRRSPRSNASASAREDVRHIVITHLDVDHIGGLSDFPDARIHVTRRPKRLGAIRSPSWRAEDPLPSRPMGHISPTSSSTIRTARNGAGSPPPKNLTDLAPGIALISLPGHTRGHACVAVDAGHRWVLHSGDAFYHYGTLDGQSPVPLAS